MDEWRGATMRHRVLNTVAAMVVAAPAVLTAGVGTAACRRAQQFLTFTQNFRRCDFSTRHPYRADGSCAARPPSLRQHRLRTDRRRAGRDVPSRTTPYDVRIDRRCPARRRLAAMPVIRRDRLASLHDRCRGRGQRDPSRPRRAGRDRRVDVHQPTGRVRADTGRVLHLRFRGVAVALSTAVRQPRSVDHRRRF